ncbi:hypothetical protein M758_12G016000 [Ceratodon purpureus]|nr:hypothetical protein M758_12G016000 [Ceratodon purpureus]
MLQGLMRVQSNDNNPKFWNISLARFGAVAIAMDMARVSESVFSETKERLIGNPNRDHANVFPAARDRAPTFICYCSREKPPELSDLDESVLPTFCLHWRVLESKLLSMCISSASPIFSWRLSPLYISSYGSCSTSLSTCLLLSFFAAAVKSLDYFVLESFHQIPSSCKGLFIQDELSIE